MFISVFNSKSISISAVHCNFFVFSHRTSINLMLCPLVGSTVARILSAWKELSKAIIHVSFSMVFNKD